MIQTYTMDVGEFAMTVDPQDRLIVAEDGEGKRISNALPDKSSDRRISDSEGYFSGLALDPLGRLFVSEGLSAQYIVRLDPASGSFCNATEATIQVSVLAGSGDGTIGYSGDGGPAAAATFNSPVGLAVDGGGNVFIADSGQRRDPRGAGADDRRHDR